MDMGIETISEHGCFGGVQGFYRHASGTIGLPMRFSVYRPPQALQNPDEPLPVLMYLAGLTCNEETFAIKAGAQQWAAEHGLILLAPDTSPRDSSIAGADEAWDFGIAASFYLDAEQMPWQRRWRMESYLTLELLPLVLAHFKGRSERVGIFGHSMGGHGALTLGLRHPELFHSVSAFAPIGAPSQCPWGRKAFTGYLGTDESLWAEHDATALMAARHTAPYPGGILIDQGLADKFLSEQLNPHLFEAACARAGQALQLRWHAGYDHGYYFISTFMADHLNHHARQLSQ